MERFNYSEGELRGGRSNGRFRELMAFEVQRTRELFRQGLALIPKVSGRLRLDLRLFSLGGLAVLDAIEAMGYDVLQRRPTLTRARKAWLVARGLLPVSIRVEKAA
jgi:phytoene/squalene synthetase